MSKFKIVFIVLCVATIVWGITFYITLQEYHRYLEWFNQSEWGKWGLAEPYWGWNGGIYVCVTGMFLFVAWYFFIGYFLSEKVYPYIRRRLKKNV